MTFKRMRLQNRLGLPLIACIILVVTIAMGYLYISLSNKINIFSDHTLENARHLSQDNITKFNATFKANARQLNHISETTLEQFRRFQVSATDDLLQLASRPFEKAFNTGDKRSVKMWLRRQGAVESVNEVSVLNKDGIVRFSSEDRFLDRTISEDMMTRLAKGEDRVQVWTDDGMETYITKKIERKCSRCHIHQEWRNRIGEVAGYFYLRVSTKMFDQIKSESQELMADQKAESQLLLSRLTEASKQASNDLEIENTRGISKIRQSSAKMIGLSILIILISSFLLIHFLVKKIMTKPVSNMAASLTECSALVSEGSKQISSASHLAAKGSSEQAVSIQEAASSLEEMSAMTKQNASSAGETDRIVKETRQIVDRANASMNELTEAMDKISNASKETSNIVHTIDEIAFQTNLLALNAAVEAARAGDAGAGFAVVSEEVRNLALRSAEAAKKTSGLIQGTIKKIETGVVLANRTNEDFDAVANGTQRIAGLVSEIALATDEQSRGIEQVNNAVSEMDKTVQQSAAHAEESASVSKEMDSQADIMNIMVAGLTDLVEGEKLSGKNGNSDSNGRLTGRRLTKQLPLLVRHDDGSDET